MIYSISVSEVRNFILLPLPAHNIWYQSERTALYRTVHYQFLRHLCDDNKYYHIRIHFHAYNSDVVN